MRIRAAGSVPDCAEPVIRPPLQHVASSTQGVLAKSSSANPMYPIWRVTPHRLNPRYGANFLQQRGIRIQRGSSK